ncbi:tetratricopeptide repeat protein [Porphyromonas sp. COT-290 OH860]|uniref:tetratricopeptide repeat protein n=1 Tax=Porphyromonas sp. COT-290 OH860 TaxID=1515615 RepID=UPI00052B617A|nr:tetratricopeptide repeat protein [Porphyromonas sp. COT-290 OH860]KGN84864.1 hypothetical protein HQ41_03890 [Porphyromonas sp. COT-290 OH860]
MESKACVSTLRTRVRRRLKRAQYPISKDWSRVKPTISRLLSEEKKAWRGCISLTILGIISGLLLLLVQGLINQYDDQVDEQLDTAIEKTLEDTATPKSKYATLSKRLEEYYYAPASFKATDENEQILIEVFSKRISEHQTASNFHLQQQINEASRPGINSQYIRALLAELPLGEGQVAVKRELEEMFLTGRIHSEEMKNLVYEIALFALEHTDKLTEEIELQKQAGNDYLAETLMDIKEVLTGKSKRNLTSIYEDFKDKKRQDEINIVRQLIEAAEAQYSFEEAYDFYNRLIELDSPEKKWDYIRPHLRVLSLHTAEAMNALGIAFSRCENQKKAEGLLEYSLKSFLSVAQEEPQKYNPKLATMLNNTGVALRNVGSLEKSKIYLDKALEIRLGLTQLNPQTYLPNVAETLSNLRDLYYEIGNLEKAEACFKKELKIRLRLTNERLYADTYYAANNLLRLGVLHKETGDYRQAKEYLEDALQAYQRHAKGSPQAFLYINDFFGSPFKNITDFKEAKTPSGRRAKVYDELVGKNLQAYLLDLATTLNSLGNLLKNIGELEGAQISYAEALNIYRELAEQNPQAYNPDVATTLNNLGIVLKNIGELKKAQTHYEEALKIRRELADKNPQAYKPDVAGVLNNLGVLLQNLGELKKAQTHYEEALKIRRELADKNPQVYKPYVATTQQNLAILYWKLRMQEKAEEAYQEARNILHELASFNPKAYGIDYASTLVMGGVSLGKPTGELEEAKAILLKYPEHPKAKRLLEIIDKRLKEH